jgi:hypothetical protein
MILRFQEKEFQEEVLLWIMGRFIQENGRKTRLLSMGEELKYGKTVVNMRVVGYKVKPKDLDD